jgi:hypothetical protein
MIGTTAVTEIPRGELIPSPGIGKCAFFKLTKQVIIAAGLVLSLILNGLH